MKIPRDLSGEDLVRLLCRDWNYRVVHRIGGHVILETEIPPIRGSRFLRTGAFGWAH